MLTWVPLGIVRTTGAQLQGFWQTNALCLTMPCVIRVGGKADASVAVTVAVASSPVVVGGATVGTAGTVGTVGTMVGSGVEVAIWAAATVLVATSGVLAVGPKRSSPVDGDAWRRLSSKLIAANMAKTSKIAAMRIRLSRVAWALFSAALRAGLLGRAGELIDGAGSRR